MLLVDRGRYGIKIAWFQPRPPARSPISLTTLLSTLFH